MTGRRIVLRADATLEIGSGHVVRSLTLGRELARRGWAVSLACRPLPPGLARSVAASGVDVIDLPGDLAFDDEPAFLGRRLVGPVDATVVDHYAIGASWQRAAVGWAGVLLAIDDLADRYQAVDLVLNPNLGASDARYAGLVPPGSKVLVGPKFALVDPSFAEARPSSASVERPERILVFLSGTDPHDVTGLAARAASTLGWPVDVVVGAAYPHLDRLRAWAAEAPRVSIHVDTWEMARLMAGAGIAVGAAGTASWERCAVGLAAVLVNLAENQVENARLLAAAGAAVDLGDWTSVTEDDVAGALTALANDPGRLRAMSNAAAGICDGRGVARVADALEARAMAGEGRTG